MKISKSKLIISSLLTLLPMFFGLALWNKLPNSIPFHWNMAGEVDGYASRGTAVFLAPIFILAVHLLCIFATKLDKGNRDQNEKVFALIYYITPAISIVAHGFVYAAAFGYGIDVTAVMGIMFGIILIAIGNYMPKAKQNHTIGIKIPWTLRSEANWNATHRLAGRLWFASGFVVLAAAFLPNGIGMWVLLGLSLVVTVVPTLYSYLFYKKEKSDSE